MKRGVLILTGFVLAILLIDFEWIKQLRQENMDYFTEGVLEDAGYGLLLITIPLMTLQGAITVFPVLILILIHFVAFGFFEGFIYSIIGTTLGALFCYWLAEGFGGKWINRFWEKRQQTMDWLLKWITKYGGLILIILRSIPFIPSNAISVAAALSPVSFQQYLWSTVLGNISMIWLLSLLSAPFWIKESMFLPYLSIYIFYCVCVFAFYIYHSYSAHRLYEVNK